MTGRELKDGEKHEDSKKIEKSQEEKVRVRESKTYLGMLDSQWNRLCHREHARFRRSLAVK